MVTTEFEFNTLILEWSGLGIEGWKSALSITISVGEYYQRIDTNK